MKGSCLTIIDTEGRPIYGGISVGSSANNWLSGTLGGFVEDDQRQIYILSCNHVLLNCGDAILQQAPGDGGINPPDVIATTSCSVPLRNSPPPYNLVDAAVAKVDNSVKIIRSIHKLGIVSKTIATAQQDIDDQVEFVGKESGNQTAYIHHLIKRIKVDIGHLKYLFEDVFVLRPRQKLYVGSLSLPGDSGAWIVKRLDDGTYGLCGLLVADNGMGGTLCCFIEQVLAELATESGLNFKVH